jgi:hypothetical protein
VRRVLSVFSVGVGLPIRHGCWIEPIMRGGGVPLRGVEQKRLPEFVESKAQR